MRRRECVWGVGALGFVVTIGCETAAIPVKTGPVAANEAGVEAAFMYAYPLYEIARTGQKLMLTSDARTRFERGVDPAFLDDGLAILTKLILDICGGEPSRVTRAGTPPVDAKRVPFKPERAAGLGGIDVPSGRDL